MYAVVESGGQQFRVEQGQSLLVDRLRAAEGDKVLLRPVFFRGDGDEVVLDGGELEKVKVEAVVREHLRGPKIRVLKYKPKKGYRRRAGHRSELTRLEISELRKLSRKPAAKGAGKRGASSKAAASEEGGGKAAGGEAGGGTAAAPEKSGGKAAAGDAGTTARKDDDGA